jgi:hypothetical protein
MIAAYGALNEAVTQHARRLTAVIENLAHSANILGSAAGALSVSTAEYQAERVSAEDLGKQLNESQLTVDSVASYSEEACRILEEAVRMLPTTRRLSLWMDRIRANKLTAESRRRKEEQAKQDIECLLALIESRERRHAGGEAVDPICPSDSSSQMAVDQGEPQVPVQEGQT